MNALKARSTVFWLFKALFQGLVWVCVFSVSTEASLLKKPFRVVLDPGHGGEDHGASARSALKSLHEKELTLALAQKTAQVLRQKGYSVILTREKDIDVPLSVRTSLANKVGADVFVSIHLNSQGGPQGGAGNAHGAETYILNNTSDASSRRLAELENTVLEPEARSRGATETDLALILKDLRLDANLGESKKLACAAQSELTRSSMSSNRGVRQALFFVLLGADMPSILVEAGFISNSKDRALLSSPKGQLQFAQNLGRAIERFKQAKQDPTTHQALEQSCIVKN